MKNKMMRIASILLVATLLTTCAISGTFAKYVTKASGEDTARVAKWGIVLGISGGDAFDTQYPASDEAYLEAGGEYSVVSSNDDKVVAPGTSSEELEMNLVATVKGTPEVAARYAITGTVKDIVLAAGEYTDYTNLVPTTTADGTTYGYTDTFELEENYSPVKWNLIIRKGSTELNVADALYANLPEALITKAEAYGLTKSGCSFFSAVEILKKVASSDTYKQVVDEALSSIVNDGRDFQLDVTGGVFTLSYDFDANKVMDFEFELSWEWAFEQLDDNGDLIEIYDMADTFLGNWAAVELGDTIEGFEAPTDEISSLEIGATLTASATQID
ncbi:MAG: hypothetical protein J5912_02835 [Clostridia bacterium]|nr:hypothetical protein [Clostridia bacterium]